MTGAVETLVNVVSGSASLSDWLWSIEPRAMTHVLMRPGSAQEADEDSPVMRTDIAVGAGAESAGKIAVINIGGVMMKRRYYSDDTSTAAVRDEILAAAADESVAAILLLIDSPGGSVAGLAELGDAITAACERKPVWSQSDGMIASAAYYAASRTQRIVAGRMDLIGSIGTRMYIIDASQLFSNLGLEAVAIDTGDYKSTGAFGTKLTDEQRAYLQTLVDGMQQEFASTVQRGRDLTPGQLAKIADGRVFLAADAMESGLIDAIGTFEETIVQLSALVAQTNQQNDGGKAMSKDTTATSGTDSGGNAAATRVAELNTTVEQTAASFAELKAGLPGASAGFICDCLDKSLTMEQARRAHVESLSAEVAELKAKAENASAAANAAANGVDDSLVAEGSSGSQGGDAGSATAFRARLKELQSESKSRLDAMRQAIDEDPDGHAAWLDEHNAKHEDALPSRQAERLQKMKQRGR